MNSESLLIQKILEFAVIEIIRLLFLVKNLYSHDKAKAGPKINIIISNEITRLYLRIHSHAKFKVNTDIQYLNGLFSYIDIIIFA